MSGATGPASANSPGEALRIKRSCARFLSHHQPLSGAAWLSTLSAGNLDVDFYGEGEALAAFEAEIASRLGKPAAVFFPTGVMAQLAALRVVADRSGVNSVAMHPRCHIAAEEDGAFALLHGLSATALTVEARQPTLADFHALEQPVGSLVIELPLRRVAFALPSWDDLRALTSAARESGVWIHLDGARLWECTPFYRRSAAQIAALADSVYVSLYKGLGGIAGAMLVGSEAFIREARLWRLRQGGVLRSVFPLVEAGRRGLEKHLPRMTTYVENAAAVAAALREIPGVDTAPTTPAINAFQVHFPFPRLHLEKAHLSFAAACGAWLFDSFRDSDAGRSHADVTIGDAVEHWGLASAVGAVSAFLANVNS